MSCLALSVLRNEALALCLVWLCLTEGWDEVFYVLTGSVSR